MLTSLLFLCGRFCGTPIRLTLSVQRHFFADVIVIEDVRLSKFLELDGLGEITALGVSGGERFIGGPGFDRSQFKRPLSVFQSLRTIPDVVLRTSGQQPRQIVVSGDGFGIDPQYFPVISQGGRVVLLKLLQCAVSEDSRNEIRSKANDLIQQVIRLGQSSFRSCKT